MQDINSMQDLLKLQQEFTTRIGRQLDALNERKKLTVDGLVAQLTGDLDATKAAITKAGEERASVVKYWDERIGSLEERAAKQSDELKRLQEQIKSSARPKPPVTVVAPPPPSVPANPRTQRMKTSPARKK